jgi:RNA polymerase sigma-70 factor (ECF subfamily)
MLDGETMSGDDEAAFRRLYKDNVAVVYRYVAARHRASAERADVADVVADVFAVAWRRRSDRPTGTDERFWLFGVARRVLADHRRSDQRRRRLFLRIVAQPPAPGAASGVDGELAHRLDTAMSRLRENDREALRLVAWDDLSRSEAAAAIGCSVNALNIRVHRALKRLSAELDPGASVARAEPGRGALNPKPNRLQLRRRLGLRHERRRSRADRPRHADVVAGAWCQRRFRLPISACCGTWEQAGVCCRQRRRVPDR